MRTVVLRVVALALLLLLALVAIITVRTLQRVPDTLVYFVRDQGTSFTLEPVKRRLGRLAPTERLRLQLAELVRGPSAAEAGRGLLTSVPQGSTVLGASLDGGVLRVDLSGPFESGGGTASMLGRLNQLFFTLTQSADVTAVRLQVEGRDVEAFGGEGIIVPQPWVREAGVGLPVW